ncbi:hypothetical protein DFH09DRAFT_1497326 [Mycena vulgaris]|nr:hypothetical protein DFH09DRAFT_1497326 [Mycena vulgaris]
MAFIYLFLPSPHLLPLCALSSRHSILPPSLPPTSVLVLIAYHGPPRKHLRVILRLYSLLACSMLSMPSLIFRFQAPPSHYTPSFESFLVFRPLSRLPRCRARCARLSLSRYAFADTYCLQSLFSRLLRLDCSRTSASACSSPLPSPDLRVIFLGRADAALAHLHLRASRTPYLRDNHRPQPGTSLRLRAPVGFYTSLTRRVPALASFDVRTRSAREYGGCWGGACTGGSVAGPARR